MIYECALIGDKRAKNIMSKNEMSYLKTLSIEIADYHWWSAAIGVLTAFLWNVQPFITLLICLVIADLITGMIAAKYKKDKIITSRGIWRTVEKIIVQLLAILACEGIRVTLVPYLDITFVVVFVIATAELKSLLENTEIILGISIWTFIKEKIGIK